MDIATSILKRLETSSSIGMFARDTGGCLISRLALSRSSDESREISFCELSESALFYFGAPVLSNIASKIFPNSIKQIGEYKNLEKNIKISKFLKIASVFGLILPIIYAIAPVRNLLTYFKSGKEKFSEVINLEKNENKKKDDKNNAENFIKNTLLVSALALLSVFCFGGILSKSDKIYKKIEPLIDKINKNFDFDKSGDLKLIHYGALIYPVSILGYLKASRDKYEKKENIRRFSITVPLLLFGEKLIQNPIYKTADKIFKTNVFNNGKINKYDDIFKMPPDLQKNALKSKNLAYGSTFFINTMFIAGAVALLNRIKTKNDFNKERESDKNLCQNQKNTLNLALQNSILKEKKEKAVWKPFFANIKQMNS